MDSQDFSHVLKLHTIKSKMKCMFITFFDLEDLVYIHTMPDGQTVNNDWYIEILKRLIMVHILHKQPHYRVSQRKLHQDNACLHVAQCIWAFLTLQGLKMIPHTPYSLNFSPVIFLSFLQVRETSRTGVLNLHRQHLGLHKLLSNIWHKTDFNMYLKNGNDVR